MFRFNPKKGLIFNAIERMWTLNKRLPSNQLQFESDVGEILNLSDEELLSNWQKGVWQVNVESLGVISDSIYLVTPADLSTYPMKWQELARRRKEYINAVDPQSNKFNKANWNEKIKAKSQEINDSNPPCPHAVHSWWRKYRISKSINSLLPRSRSGLIKKQSDAFKIFEEAIQTHFLNQQKVPVKVIAEKVQQKISVTNIGRELDNKIKLVSLPTIYRWVEKLRSDIQDSSRLGAKVARNKYRTVTGQLQVDSILERVEMDHTPLDLIVIDQTTMLPLGRPWLTIAIDKYSRMVLGFYISFNTPSAYSVLQCLKQVIMPKNEILAQYPDIKNKWPAFGIPELLALDNGMDFHSEALNKTCLDMGIQMLFCPAATPWMKGSVERFFRTISHNLIHQLPGTTFSNIADRGDYQAEKLATIDLATLTHLIVKWIVDVYNVTPHRGISETPLNKWNQSAITKIIELPVYPTELDIMTGIPAQRTVFHYGIELDGLHYNNKALQELRRISGENLPVQLKFYEDQVLFIDVFDPFEKHYIRVESINPDYAKDLHREAHRLSRAQARKNFGEQFSFAQLAQAREEIEKIVDAALKDKIMRNRKKAMNTLHKNSQSILNTKHSKSRQQKPSEGLLPPPQLDDGLEDDLPNIDHISKRKKP